MLSLDHALGCQALRGAALALLAIALAGSLGCADGLPRGAVKGRVTVNGKPLDKGRILFTPLAPNAGPTASAVIRAGLYELPRAEGPIAGNNRVEIDADRDLGFELDDEAAFVKRGGAPLPRSPIPPQFNRDSTLSTTIQEGENVYDVNLRTK